MSHIRIEISYEIVLDLEHALFTLFQDLAEYGELPQSKPEALETLKRICRFGGSDEIVNGEMAGIETEWNEIARDADQPPYQEFKKTLLEWFPELGQ